MGRILQRCDVCKGFHVVYIVDDPLFPGGKAHYCHRCWKSKFGAKIDQAHDLPSTTKHAVKVKKTTLRSARTVTTQAEQAKAGIKPSHTADRTTEPDQDQSDS